MLSTLKLKTCYWRQHKESESHRMRKGMGSILFKEFVSRTQRIPTNHKRLKPDRLKQALPKRGNPKG